MNGGDGMECLVCHNAAKNGCLTFCGVALCEECEMRLMEQQVDEPGYDVQVQAFRLLWQRQLGAARDRHQGDGANI